MMTITDAKRGLIKQFREAGLETPDLDARAILVAATGFTPTEIITRGGEDLSGDTICLLEDYTARRLSGEPVDHIQGFREFYGRRFKVNNDVLSPRPETEMLVDKALEILKFKDAAHILDLGTGSGAIILSILAETNAITGEAVDLSAAALKIAKENADAHDISGRVTFHQGSWFTPVSGCFDIILSNPPYITATAMENLEKEVKGFDPDLALRGGTDGLDAYRAIISKAANYLVPHGTLLFEIGYDQGETVSHLLEEAGFSDIFVHQDLSAHDRMIKAVFNL